MATDEDSQRRLHRKLDEVLGPEHATTLMRLLSSGTVDRSDPHVPEERTSFTEPRYPDLHAHMERVTREVILWTCFMMIAVGALAFAAGRFV